MAKLILLITEFLYLEIFFKMRYGSHITVVDSPRRWMFSFYVSCVVVTRGFILTEWACACSHLPMIEINQRTFNYQIWWLRSVCESGWGPISCNLYFTRIPNLTTRRWNAWQEITASITWLIYTRSLRKCRWKPSPLWFEQGLMSRVCSECEQDGQTTQTVLLNLRSQAKKHRAKGNIYSQSWSWFSVGGSQRSVISGFDVILFSAQH